MSTKKDNGELAVVAPSRIVVRENPAEIPVSVLISQAIESKIPTEQLERLFALHERMEAARAGRAFAEALAQFRAKCPKIQRTAANNQFPVVGADGIKRPRMYADLNDIATGINKPLADCGLSYRWGDAVISDGNKVTMACIVTHQMGHSISSSVTLPIDSRAGCSDLQKFGTAQTYAMRYSLIQALGLTSAQVDNDGNDPQATGEKIDDHTVENLKSAMDDVGVAHDDPKFLAFFGVGSIHELTERQAQTAFATIERKRKNRNGGAA